MDELGLTVHYDINVTDLDFKCFVLMCLSDISSSFFISSSLAQEFLKLLVAENLTSSLSSIYKLNLFFGKLCTAWEIFL